MIAKWSRMAASRFSGQGLYSPDDEEVCAYGFELLISTALNSLLILISSILMGVALESILFLAAFIPLRMTAGGCHAKRHWSCIALTSCSFLACAVALKILAPGFALPLSIFAMALSIAAVLALSPVEAPNKPLTMEERGAQRKRSIAFVSFGALVVPILFLLQLKSTFPAFYSAGAFAASLSLIAAKAAGAQKGNASERAL
jgi:accessory gene regulator B